MKYVGESTPAWTFSGKQQPRFDQSGSASPVMYPWGSAKDFVSPSSPHISLYVTDRITSFEKTETKLLKAIAEIQTAKPKSKARSKKKVNFDIEKPSPQAKAGHPTFSAKLGFFNKTKRFNGPPPSTLPEVGPMTYEIKDAKPREVSMAYKTEADVAIKPREGLGPGIYDPGYKVIDKEQGAISYSRQLKAKLASRVARSQSPGPGYYDAHAPTDDGNFHSKKGTFSLCKREVEGVSLSTGQLGPGAYNAAYGSIEERSRQQFKKPLLSHGPKRSFSLEIDEMPGPGKYSIVKVRDRFQGGVIARAPRFREKAVDSLNMEEDSRVKGKTRSLSAPKKANSKVEGFTTFGKSVRRGMDEHRLKVPGPGDYELDQRHSQTAAIFGREKKALVSNSREIPGPGAYDLSLAGDFGEGCKRLGCLKYMPRHVGRPVLRDPSPGPQDYKINYEQVFPSASLLATRFPRDKKQFRWQEGDPDMDTAPGLYDLKATLPQLPPFETPEARERGIRGLFG